MPAVNFSLRSDYLIRDRIIDDLAEDSGDLHANGKCLVNGSPNEEEKQFSVADIEFRCPQRGGKPVLGDDKTTDRIPGLQELAVFNLVATRIASGDGAGAK